jgi:hypothetical protein
MRAPSYAPRSPAAAPAGAGPGAPPTCARTTRPRRLARGTDAREAALRRVSCMAAGWLGPARPGWGWEEEIGGGGTRRGAWTFVERRLGEDAPPDDGRRHEIGATPDFPLSARRAGASPGAPRAPKATTRPLASSYARLQGGRGRRDGGRRGGAGAGQGWDGGAGATAHAHHPPRPRAAAPAPPPPRPPPKVMGGHAPVPDRTPGRRRAADGQCCRAPARSCGSGWRATRRAATPPARRPPAGAGGKTPPSAPARGPGRRGRGGRRPRPGQRPVKRSSKAVGGRRRRGARAAGVGGKLGARGGGAARSTLSARCDPALAAAGRAARMGRAAGGC